MCDYMPWTKEQHRVYMQKWRIAHPGYGREADTRWLQENRTWVNERHRKYVAKRLMSEEYREQKRRSAREDHLRHAFGMSLDDYTALFDAQRGRCAICSEQSEKSLHVDHDHETRRIRGLLCFKCNAMLGNAGDDPRVLIRAAAYLGITDGG